MAKRTADLYERELERYREILRLDPNVAADRYGWTLINSLDPAERALFLREMGWEITEAVDFYNLGCHAASEENWSEAIVHFKRAAENAPNMLEAFYNLALCFEKTGHIPQARATWEIYLGSIGEGSERSRINEHLATLS
jgi:tetratricopeptide (TPR) repeat protein